MNKYIYIIIFLLFGLSWFYPFHYMPWMTAENEFFCLLIPLSLSFFFFKYNNEIKINSFVVIPLLVLIFSLAQFFLFNDYYLEDLVLVAIYSLFSIIVLILSCSFYSKDNFIRLLGLIVFLSIFNSVIISLQYFEVKSIFLLEHFGRQRFYGNIGQPNHISTLLCMGVVSSFLLYRLGLFNSKKLYFISFLFIFFIFLTGSRAGILILILMGFWLLWGFKEIEIKNKIKYILSITIFYNLIQYFFVDNSRFKSGKVSALDQSRLELWSDAISIIQSNPFLGYGVNGVKTARIFGDLSFKIPYVSSHNMILDIFIWFGFLGGGILLCFLLYFLLIILIKENNRDIVILFLIPFLIHCMLEYPFRYLYFLILVLPIVGLISKFKVVYLSKSLFLILLIIYIFLISIVFWEFNKYSKGAFLGHTQRCMMQQDHNPIILDLMSNYSMLYCNVLNDTDMERLVYRYSYAYHMQFLAEKNIENNDFKNYLLKKGK